MTTTPALDTTSLIKDQPLGANTFDSHLLEVDDSGGQDCEDYNKIAEKRAKLIKYTGFVRCEECDPPRDLGQKKFAGITDQREWERLTMIMTALRAGCEASPTFWESSTDSKFSDNGYWLNTYPCTESGKYQIRKSTDEEHGICDDCNEFYKIVEKKDCDYEEIIKSTQTKEGEEAAIKFDMEKRTQDYIEKQAEKERAAAEAAKPQPPAEKPKPQPAKQPKPCIKCPPDWEN